MYNNKWEKIKTESDNEDKDGKPILNSKERHYNIESDGEPPSDKIGDKLTIIPKKGCIKEILVSGEGLGKPGKPMIVDVTLKGYYIEDKVEVVFWPLETTKLTLGDPKLPLALWRAIE